MLFILSLAASCVLQAARAAPAPQQGDKFGPQGELGSALAAAGDVPNGPAPKGCSKYELIYARGTGEPGTFGVIAGDQLVAAVTKALPDARGYAVQYPANFNVSVSSNKGAVDVINRLNSQSKECPEQKFAVSGYSQGAGVMHLALGPNDAKMPYITEPKPVLDKNARAKIVAAVMFGDPGFKGTQGPLGVPSPVFADDITKVTRQNCAPGDPVCDPKGTSFEWHLEYIKNPWQSESANFIISAFQNKPLPKAVKTGSDPEWIATAEKTRPKALAQGAASPPKEPAALTLSRKEGF